MLGPSRSAINALSVRLSRGHEGTGRDHQRHCRTSPRQGEQTGFLKSNFEASRTQTLFAPWEGASVA